MGLLLAGLLIGFALSASASSAEQAKARPAKPAATRPRPSPEAARSPQDEARLLKEFSDRVAEYVKLRNGAADKLPKLKEKAEPAEIAAHQKALAEGIRSARAGARQGDLFSPEVQPVLRRALGTELKGPGSTPDRKTVETEGNPKAEGPTKPVVLKVNASYTEAAPLSSVPPDVLRRLPPLPEEVDYRFVGRHLILRDAVANVIVDFILDAAPAPKAAR